MFPTVAMNTDPTPAPDPIRKSLSPLKMIMRRKEAAVARMRPRLRRE